MGGFSIILITYCIVLFFLSVFSLGLIIFQGFGMSAMCKGLNIKNRWMCYVPALNYISMGKIAEKYEKRDGKKPAKFSFWLIALTVISIIALIGILVTVIIAMSSLATDANTAIEQNSLLEYESFLSFIPVVVAYLVTAAAQIAFNIFYYIALWRIFAIYDNKNATVYLVLSIFVSILVPIFIFMLRNKEPKLTYAQRMGFNEPIFEVETSTVETEN